jgi:hypothetical protein
MSSKKKFAKPAKTKAPKVDKAKASMAEAPAKVERIARNGITQPGEGTACRAIWDACDKQGKQATFESLRAVIDSKVADATIRTQRQRWKSYGA